MMDTNLPFEPVKLNAGSDPTKAKEMSDAGTPKEEEQPVLGKRARDAQSEPTTDGKKKTKVEESAESKADRRRILEEKKRMLAQIESELAKISRKPPSLSSSTPGLKQSASAPTTPMLSASTPLPAPRGRGRGRGAGRAAASPASVVPVAIEPEGDPATTTTVFADPPAPPARGKRKSSGAGIPRRASHDVSTLPTSPTPEGPVTRAKRARRPKRLDAYGGPVQLTWALKQCQVLLKTLMTHRFGWPFNQPVDPIALNIPDYFDVIKNPMDLGTIKEQLDSGSYDNEDEFATDVRLVFSNTFTYNQPGSDIVLMASTLSGIFEEKFKALKSKVGDHIESGEAVEQSMRELRESVSTIQRDLERVKKTSNGRGRAEDQRPMTFDEKKKLSQAINTLPSEHLGMVVKIIHERMPQLTASGEEIEIDIDALNPATLRHLERFVRSVTQRTAGRSRRGSRTPSLSKSVQNESLVPQGTQQKIEDVERQIKALTEHQQALTQKGLARSGEGDVLLAAAEKKRNDESETSESESDGSDSESSDSESSDSESDSGSDSDSTDSESEKKGNIATATVVTSTQPATESLATTVTAPTSVPSDLTAGESSSEVPAAADVTSASVAGEAAASAPSPATTPMSSGVEDEKSAAHHTQENGKAISFSFDPKDSILPAEAGNGDESLTQAAVAMDDAPPKSEAPKQVALKNVDAWSELSDDFETPATAVKPQSPPSLDKTWSQFQTKKMQDAIREKERLEKEERERKERERREEERRLEEERRRREQEEAEERRRREQEEAELAAQRERERQRQAERLARERGDLSVMEQSLLMASFEQQAPPALPIFQYKSLDDVSEFGDLDDDDAPPATNDHASSNGSHPAAALDDDAPHPLFDGEEEEPEPEPPRVVNPATSSFGAGEEVEEQEEAAMMTEAPDAGPVEDAMDQEEAAPAPQ